jgi:uncharacterized protein (TIGR02246 family)
MSVAQSFDFASAIESAIDEVIEAAREGDADRLAACYAEEATILPPGSPPVSGSTAIRAFWQGFIDAGAEAPELLTTSVASSGDLAYEIGTWKAVVPLPTGGVGPASGNYLVVWKRQEDGSIKIVADMFAPV